MIGYLNSQIGEDNYIIDGLISCLKHDDISALSVDEQYKIYHNGELVEPAFSKVIIAVGGLKIQMRQI